MPRLLSHQVWVETDRPQFPQRCVSCFGPAEAEYRPTPPPRARGLPEPNHPLTIPYCETCLRAFRAHQSLATRGLVALNVAVWGSYALLSVMPLGTSLAVMLPVGAAIYLPAWLRSRSIQRRESAVDGMAMRAIWYRRSTYVFSFENEAYANEFRAANRTRLSKEAR